MTEKTATGSSATATIHICITPNKYQCKKHIVLIFLHDYRRLCDINISRYFNPHLIVRKVYVIIT